MGKLIRVLFRPFSFRKQTSFESSKSNLRNKPTQNKKETVSDAKKDYKPERDREEFIENPTSGFYVVRHEPRELTALRFLCENELNSKSKSFIDFAQHAVKLVSSSNTIDPKDIMKLTTDGITLEEKLINLSSILNDQLTLDQVIREPIDKFHTIGFYVHEGVSLTVGQSFSYIVLKSDKTNNDIQELADMLSAHVFFQPSRFMTKAQVPQDQIEEIKEEVLTKMKGKPKILVEKKLDKRLNDFFRREVLSEQQCRFSAEKNILHLIKGVSKKVEAKIEVERFAVHRIFSEEE